jgi:DNA mismatch repair protein MutS
MSKSKKVSVSKDPETGIYYEYFQHTKNYQKQYGTKTVVLMQVGAFFEVYGIKTADNDLTESIIEEFSNVCQLNVSEKKISYGGGQIVMAGFRDFTLEKYLLILTDNGFTIPVFVQEKNGKEVTRILSKVYSSGTYLSCETDSSPIITNYTMCIWLETFTHLPNGSRDIIVYGVSVINIFTGKSSMFQYETSFFMNTTTFDELERYVSIYCPSEVIILSPFEDKDVQSIIQMSGIQSQMIQSQMIHLVNTKPLEKKENTINKQLDKVQRCSSQKYTKQILSNFFGEEAYDLCNEFQTYNMATQSFCYLLNFVQEHNAQLVRKISIPEFNNTSTRMILANHTLSQLNIIHDMNSGSKHGQFSCVLSFLNKCCSSMGKRRFQYQLLNPNFDEDWLNTEYKMIDAFLNNYYLVDIFRKQLAQIRDIEKISRQLVIKKIYPSSIAYLYKSVENIKQINNCLFELPDVSEYLCNDFENLYEKDPYYINNSSNKLAEFIDKSLIIDLCKNISSMTSFDANIIQPGISSELDDLVLKYSENQEKFNKIRQYFNGLIQTQENSPDTDYVKIHETEKSGVCLQITSKRSLLLKKGIESELSGKKKYGNVEKGCIIIDETLKFPLKDVKFVKPSSSSVDISFTELDTICKNLLNLKDLMNLCIGKVYIEFLANLEQQFYVELENIASFVSKVDVLQSKTYIAKNYNYCRPVIKSAEKSFVDARELRHCLIEHIQQNEIYVTNDICLGETQQQTLDGILLYGTNAVGKTSLIRALGVAIIMAQTGMYVPCSQFTYKPYTAIYSRILGNDNLFKGLSTFAVEMTELRIILKMADENSLILGDELCSGTEAESALSIFVAGLMKLDEKRCSYIFATHFHEIVNYEEIRELSKLAMKHMSVLYDRETDCLVYDRKLKDGSGPRIYGLEVCKSLYLDTEFLDLAYSIRNKYYPDSRGELSSPITIYNSNKLRGICEVCGEKMGEETHHLSPQKDADVNGYIGTFHKNHKANLVSVCEKCHNKIHSNNEKLVKKKTTKG